MGMIREPQGVDFIVDTRQLKDWEKKQISDIISHYKKTGEVLKASASRKNKKKEKTA